MKTYNLITFISLFILVAALPFYGLREASRMEIAQENLRRQAVTEGTDLYLEYCALCHGLEGEGTGVMPALNHPALAEANEGALYRTIARASHGSTMAAWHLEEGGVLNEYQIQELVTVIQYADWQQVGARALALNIDRPDPPDTAEGLAYMMNESEANPHECADCHEEPAIHVGKFGLNCARCHAATAWTPALLTKHTFPIDHGDHGQVDCEICHIANYYTHTCYECHDHHPDQMEEVHLAENIGDYANCIACHPTGQPGEGEQYRQVLLDKMSVEALMRVSNIP